MDFRLINSAIIWMLPCKGHNTIAYHIPKLAQSTCNMSVTVWCPIRLNCSAECDQFSVSISSVRYTKYIFILKSTEILSLPWKPSKVTRNLVLQRFPRCRIYWTKPFSRGGVVKKWHFFQNFHLGRNIFPSLIKSRACFEIPNIWHESHFICLTFTIKSTRQNIVVKI